MEMTRCYSELRVFETFDDRFTYLRLGGSVGRATFAFDRYVNQLFYKSSEWQNARREVILRDEGCDLGVDGCMIHVNLLVHHMNPLSLSDILQHEEWIVNPEYLITTTYNTHNAIHFGGESPYPKVVIERRPGDTKVW